jgi:predicted peptidase
MGGSGTYELASQYYDFNGQRFAAIIRLAGQSSFPMHVHEILSKSAIWIQIGLKDTPLRIEKAHEAYSIQKKLHANATETTQIINMNGHNGKTSTLMVDEMEKIKLTEYQYDGHEINNFAFTNPTLLEWLFENEIRQ